MRVADAAGVAQAERMAAVSPQRFKRLEHSTPNGAEMPLNAGVDYERTLVGVAINHPDARQGRDAVPRKRSARFTGATPDRCGNMPLPPICAKMNRWARSDFPAWPTCGSQQLSKNLTELI